MDRWIHGQMDPWMDDEWIPGWIPEWLDLWLQGSSPPSPGCHSRCRSRCRRCALSRPTPPSPRGRGTCRAGFGGFGDLLLSPHPACPSPVPCSPFPVDELGDAEVATARDEGALHRRVGAHLGTHVLHQLLQLGTCGAPSQDQPQRRPEPDPNPAPQCSPRARAPSPNSAFNSRSQICSSTPDPAPGPSLRTPNLGPNHGPFPGAKNGPEGWRGLTLDTRIWAFPTNS